MSQIDSSEVVAGQPKAIADANAEHSPDVFEKEASAWLGRGIDIVSSIIIVSIMLVAYHFAIVSPNKQKFAVVDISEVLNIKELQVTIAAMRPDASEEAKSRAYDEVAKFGKDIEGALSDLQQECGCSIFVKAAVVKAAGAEDLTLELKHRLGMENDRTEDLVKQLRLLGGGRTPIIEGGVK